MKVFWFLIHFFVGCNMPPWVYVALTTPSEGIEWTCPRCGRRVSKSSEVCYTSMGDHYVSRSKR